MNHKIGLMGFGVVGQGYHTIASTHNKDFLPYKIVIKDKNKARPNDLPFAYDADELINEGDIGIELISDSHVAYSFIKALLEKGKKVITANKKVVAANLPELIELQQRFGGSLLYEAAVAASIPILCNLETQYYGDEILELRGILNGSSNYILSQIFHNNLSLKDALTLAQTEGFAEADPSFDINGSDIASKLTILIAHGFNQYHTEASIPYYGIENIGTEEIKLARHLGLTIKLVATATRTDEGIKASILPTFIDSSDAMSAIEWEYNCIQITSKNLGEQFFKGKGAGSMPTGSAVFADLIKSIEGFKYSCAEGLQDDLELNPIDLNLVLKSDSPTTLNKYNLDNDAFISSLNAIWYIGKISSDFILSYKEDLMYDGISIIHIGDSVSIEILKQCISSIQYDEDLVSN